jgi:nicotinamide riboside transporter PnuC
MHKIILYILIAMGLIGQVLITKNKRSGYLLWVIADIAWAIFNFSQGKTLGAFEQGILWSVYFIISLWGYLIWKKK